MPLITHTQSAIEVARESLCMMITAYTFMLLMRGMLKDDSEHQDQGSLSATKTAALFRLSDFKKAKKIP